MEGHAKGTSKSSLQSLSSGAQPPRRACELVGTLALNHGFFLGVLAKGSRRLFGGSLSDLEFKSVETKYASKAEKQPVESHLSKTTNRYNGLGFRG